jgi:hypothetical protein
VAGSSLHFRSILPFKKGTGLERDRLEPGRCVQKSPMGADQCGGPAYEVGWLWAHPDADSLVLTNTREVIMHDDGLIHHLR